MFNTKLLWTKVGPFSIEFTVNYDLFSSQQYYHFVPIENWWTEVCGGPGPLIQATGWSKVEDYMSLTGACMSDHQSAYTTLWVKDDV